MKDIKKILNRVNKLVKNIKTIDGSPYVYGQRILNTKIVSLMPDLTALIYCYNEEFSITIMKYKVCQISIGIKNNNVFVSNIEIYQIILSLDGTIHNKFDELPSNLYDWHTEEFFYWNLKYGS